VIDTPDELSHYIAADKITSELGFTGLVEELLNAFCILDLVKDEVW